MNHLRRRRVYWVLNPPFSGLNSLQNEYYMGSIISALIPAGPAGDILPVSIKTSARASQ